MNTLTLILLIHISFIYSTMLGMYCVDRFMNFINGYKNKPDKLWRMQGYVYATIPGVNIFLTLLLLVYLTLYYLPPLFRIKVLVKHIKYYYERLY